VVLNQTRLKELIGAFGPNSENWIGRSIILSRVQAMYAGKPLPAVKIEPIVAPRIGVTPQGSAHSLPSQPKQTTRGSSDIRSGPGAWDSPPSSAPPPTTYDGPADVDDDIPF
jgi:hypothetical protein